MSANQNNHVDYYDSPAYAQMVWDVNHPEESNAHHAGEYVQREEHRINMIFAFCVVLVLVFCTAVVLFAH